MADPAAAAAGVESTPVGSLVQLKQGKPSLFKLTVLGCVILDAGSIPEPFRPHVILTHGGSEVRTKTLSHSREPSWDESFVFELSGVQSDMHIDIEVWLHSFFVNEDACLGSTFIDVSSLKASEAKNVPLELLDENGGVRGRLTVSYNHAQWGGRRVSRSCVNMIELTDDGYASPDIVVDEIEDEEAIESEVISPDVHDLFAAPSVSTMSLRGSKRDLTARRIPPWFEETASGRPAEQDGAVSTVEAGSEAANSAPLRVASWRTSPERVRGARTREVRDAVFVSRHNDYVFFSGRMAIVLDPNTGGQRFYSEHESDILCIAAHPCRTIAATAGSVREKKILVWAVDTLETLSAIDLVGVQGNVVTMAFSPDGTLLMTVCDDRLCTLTLWQWRTGQIVAQYSAHEDHVFTARFDVRDPAGNAYATCGVKHVMFWSKDGTTIEGNEATAPSGAPAKSAEGQGLQGRKRRTMFCMCCTAKGVFVTGGIDGALVAWLNGQVVGDVKAHSAHVTALVSCGRNGHFLSGSLDGEVKLWSEDLQPLASLSIATALRGSSEHAPTVCRKIGVRSIDCLNGEVVALLEDGSLVRLAVDVARGTLTLGPSSGLVARHHSTLHMLEVWGLDAVPPAGHAFGADYATGGDDGRILLWRAGRSLPVAEVRVDAGHGEGSVRCLSFSPDGSALFAAGKDGSVWALRADSLRSLLASARSAAVRSVVDITKEGPPLRTGSPAPGIVRSGSAAGIVRSGSAAGRLTPDRNQSGSRSNLGSATNVNGLTTKSKVGSKGSLGSLDKINITDSMLKLAAASGGAGSAMELSGSTSSLAKSTMGLADNKSTVKAESLPVVHAPLKALTTVRSCVHSLRCSPCGKFVAVGTHSGELKVARAAHLLSNPMPTFASGRGHANMITHMDWDQESRRLRTRCADGHIIYWVLQEAIAEDGASGDEGGALSLNKLSAAVSANNMDIEWATHTCGVGRDFRGAWEDAMNAVDSGRVDASDVRECDGVTAAVLGYSWGAVGVAAFPYAEKRAHGDKDGLPKMSGGHVSAVAAVVLLDSTRAVSVGGRDGAVIEWRVEREK